MPDIPYAVVIGSVNADQSLRVARIPEAGETLAATEAVTGLGGKGANQAVAMAAMGTPVHLVAHVGADEAGSRLRQTLEGWGVGTSHVDTVSAPTGRALILLQPSGQNSILLIAGANETLAPEDVDRVSSLIMGATTLVLQGEIPADVNERALSLAVAAGVRVVLNLAPVQDLDTRAADPLIVNEVEAAQLIGEGGLDSESLRAHLKALSSLARTVVVTLGAQGAALIDEEGISFIPAPVVADVVDTTGAGDAFVGVLAAELTAGEELRPALRRAVRAASASVRSAGATESYRVLRDTLPAR